MKPSDFRQHFTPSNDNPKIKWVAIGVVFLVVMPVISFFN
jgi:hypothetical protein